MVAVWDWILLYNDKFGNFHEHINEHFRSAYLKTQKFEQYQNEHIIRKQGIYCFGGKKENGEVTNDLKVLKLDGKSFVWELIDENMYKGEPPKPRYGHIMKFYERSRILIIYGGINDKRFMDDHAAYYSHMKVFNLSEFEWQSVTIYGDFQESRSKFAVAFNNSQLIVFGGINHLGHCRSNVSWFEVHQKRAERGY
jgi:hypothetical protein